METVPKNSEVHESKPLVTDQEIGGRFANYAYKIKNKTFLIDKRKHYSDMLQKLEEGQNKNNPDAKIKEDNYDLYWTKPNLEKMIDRIDFLLDLKVEPVEKGLQAMYKNRKLWRTLSLNADEIQRMEIVDLVDLVDQLGDLDQSTIQDVKKALRKGMFQYTTGNTTFMTPAESVKINKIIKFVTVLGYSVGEIKLAKNLLSFSI